METVLRGNLRLFPVADLLSYLSGRGMNGTLYVESDDRRVRIVFNKTRIILAVSNDSKDMLDAVVDSCQFETGTFELIDVAMIPETVSRGPIELTDVLAEVTRRRAAKSLFTDATHFRVVDDPAAQSQASLTGDEFRLLFRLAAGRSFRDLVNDLRLPESEVDERLRALMRHGLVTIGVIEKQGEVTDEHRMARGRNVRTYVGSLTPDGNADVVYPLLGEDYTLGRTPDNSVMLVDGSVSAKHAKITHTTDGYLIEDLQSRNGTFVNGERLIDKRLLVDGDLLRFGKVIMTFNLAPERRRGDESSAWGSFSL